MLEFPQVHLENLSILDIYFISKIDIDRCPKLELCIKEPLEIRVKANVIKNRILACCALFEMGVQSYDTPAKYGPEHRSEDEFH